MILSQSLLKGLIGLSMMTLTVPASANMSEEISSRKITVAVIDTGLDLQHPAFKNQLWINPGEHGVDELGRDKQNNGIDDDGNGFADDVHGWNFAARSGDLKDTHGHGTHIAGLIGAKPTAQNSFHGIASENVRLMILKYYDPKAFGDNNLNSSVDAIYYAVRMGADIINYSGGGTERSSDEEKALRFAQSRGVLVVAAAGNEKSNSDIRKFYPAGYGLTNIISVTAHDENMNILPSSNYGAYSVDIAALGKSVESTVPGNAYGKMTGTSQATAFVSGAAVLLLAQSRVPLQPEKAIAALIIMGSKHSSLVGKTKFKVALNIPRAHPGVSSLLATNTLTRPLTAQRTPAQSLAKLFNFKLLTRNKN